MIAQNFHIFLQFAYCLLQFVILTFQNLIFLHHHPQLLFQILKSANPLLIYHRFFDVNWNFYFYRYLDFYFFLDLHWSIDIHWLLNEYRFINDNWVFINGFVNENLFFYNFWYFNFFYDDFWDFLFYFNVFRYLHYFLHNPLRTRYILGYFCLDFNRLFQDKLLNHFFGNHVIIQPSLLSQNLVFHLKFIFISFQFVDNFFVVFARSIFSTDMIKFKLKSYPFFLAFCKFVSESMHFFEQFFEAFLVIFLVIDKNFNIFVTACRLSSHCLKLSPLIVPLRNRYRNKRLHFFQIACFSRCQVLVSTQRLGMIFLLYDNGSLENKRLPRVLLSRRFGLR